MAMKTVMLDGSGPDPLLGTPFRAVRVIGQGGMGTVYEARRRTDESPVAVKVLQAALAKDPSVRDRVRLEFDTLARLRTPEVVAVYEHGATGDGSVYVAMEMLEGRTAKELLRARGGRPIIEAVALGIQLLRALDRAHALGVLHRDLKPDNLFVLDDGTLKVLDFGIAKVFKMTQAAPDPLMMPTEEGVLIGTPRWCSPEAILAKPTDARSDIYGAGGCLYALLNGSGPFELARGMNAILDAQLTQTPPPLAPTLGCALLGPVLDEILARALAKSPDDRYPSASEMLADLNEVAFWARTLPTLVPDAAEKLSRALDPGLRPNVRLHMLRAKIPGFERLASVSRSTVPIRGPGLADAMGVHPIGPSLSGASFPPAAAAHGVRPAPEAALQSGGALVRSASVPPPSRSAVASVPPLLAVAAPAPTRFGRDVVFPFLLGALVAAVVGVAAQLAYFGAP